MNNQEDTPFVREDGATVHRTVFLYDEKGNVIGRGIEDTGDVFTNNLSPSFPYHNQRGNLKLNARHIQRQRSLSGEEDV